LRRVLTPGGRLIVSVNHPSQVWFGRPVYTVHREPGARPTTSPRTAGPYLGPWVTGQPRCASGTGRCTR
jgi:hypothetical protein